MFRHPPTAADSPLWPCFKVINLEALHRKHRRGTVRAVWLYWSLDDRRFRRSKYQRAFEQQFPGVFEATVRWLSEQFTPAELEHLEMQLGHPWLAAERARLSASRLLHAAHDRQRAEAAAAAAGEGLGPSNPRPITLDDLM